MYKNVDSVKWNFGDAASGENNLSSLLNPRHTYPGVGTYTATAVIYTRCQADTAIAFVKIDNIVSVRIPDNIKDTIICKGQDFTYDVTTPNATGYLWSTGLIYPVRKMTDSGTYSITAYNECSVDSRTFTVAIEACNCKVFVPNAFTPNKDGLNDRFKPIIDCNPLKYNFFVYDKFGQVQFKTSKMQEGWDGYIKAYPGQPGVYVWRVVYQNPNDKKVYQLKGTVTLIR